MKRGKVIIAVTALCLMFALLTAMLLLSVWKLTSKAEAYRTQLENSYGRTYYDMADNMRSLETALKKASVSTSDKSRTAYLTDVFRLSEVTGAGVASLPVSEDAIMGVTKFVNQTGDFCNYVAKKQSRGEALTQSDRDMIGSLSAICSELNAKLAKLTEKLSDGYGFAGGETYGADFDSSSALYGGMSEIEGSDIEYPSMIYDGPFSDALENTEPKALPKTTVTEKEARALIADKYGMLGYSEINGEGKTDGKLSAYNYRAKTASNGSVFFQISERGGKLLMLDVSREPDNVALSSSECEVKAVEFCESLGFSGIEAVWQDEEQGFFYVNVAPASGGVIMYPDLIKVIVAMDNGEIVGFDAKSYYINHVRREIPSNRLSALEARRSVPTELNILSERLCVIPLPAEREVFCYEYRTRVGGNEYFIYINAVTGDEENVLMTVDGKTV